jgi:hypothetical protein
MKDKQLYDKIERFNRLLHEHGRQSMLHKRLGAKIPDAGQLKEAEELLTEIKHEIRTRRRHEEKESPAVKHRERPRSSRKD